MTLLASRRRPLRRGAFAAGLVAAITLVAIGQVPAGGDALGLDVSLTTRPTGEIAVAPVGRVVAASGLLPGEGELRGRITLQSQVDAPMSVRTRQRPSLGDADQALRVRLVAGGRTLYDGPAGGLRTATRAAVRIPARGRTTLDVRAWLPERAPSGWRGRRVGIALEYLVSVDGKVRR